MSVWAAEYNGMTFPRVAGCEICYARIGGEAMSDCKQPSIEERLDSVPLNAYYVEDEWSTVLVGQICADALKELAHQKKLVQVLAGVIEEGNVEARPMFNTSKSVLKWAEDMVKQEAKT